MVLKTILATQNCSNCKYIHAGSANQFVCGRLWHQDAPFDADTGNQSANLYIIRPNEFVCSEWEGI